MRTEFLRQTGTSLTRTRDLLCGYTSKSYTSLMRAASSNGWTPSYRICIINSHCTFFALLHPSPKGALLYNRQSATPQMVALEVIVVRICHALTMMCKRLNLHVQRLFLANILFVSRNTRASIMTKTTAIVKGIIHFPA